MIRTFRRYMAQPVTSTFFGWSMVITCVLVSLILYHT